ncbi:MAG: RecX family transcriptional regulator [Microgenomates group bacterium]
MPRVTAITEQKKNAKRREAKKDKRFNIFLDGKYAFSIGEEHLLKIRLKEDQNLTSAEIGAINKEESISKLLGKSINFLSYRPRSEKELKDYLIRSISKSEKIKWSEAKESTTPDSVVQKLKKYGYIDDEEFAKWWTDSRLRARPRGRKFIELELKRKGISQITIDKVLPNNSETDLKLALQVLEKKRSKLEKLQPNELRRKVYYYLGSRGFDFDIIKEAFAIFTKRS